MRTFCFIWLKQFPNETIGRLLFCSPVPHIPGCQLYIYATLCYSHIENSAAYMPHFDRVVTRILCIVYAFGMAFILFLVGLYCLLMSILFNFHRRLSGGCCCVFFIVYHFVDRKVYICGFILRGPYSFFLVVVVVLFCCRMDIVRTKISFSIVAIVIDRSIHLSLFPPDMLLFSVLLLPLLLLHFVDFSAYPLSFSHEHGGEKSCDSLLDLAIFQQLPFNCDLIL